MACYILQQFRTILKSISKRKYHNDELLTKQNVFTIYNMNLYIYAFLLSVIRINAQSGKLKLGDFLHLFSCDARFINNENAYNCTKIKLEELITNFPIITSLIY